MHDTAICADCGDPVNLTRTSQDFRLVEGYERIHRSAGGTNALRLRRPRETFLCRWCVEKRSRGLVGQESLI